MRLSNKRFQKKWIHLYRYLTKNNKMDSDYFKKIARRPLVQQMKQLIKMKSKMIKLKMNKLLMILIMRFQRTLRHRNKTLMHKLMRLILSKMCLMKI